jgi:molybdopterin converting factor small subunit
MLDRLRHLLQSGKPQETSDPEYDQPPQASSAERSSPIDSAEKAPVESKESAGEPPSEKEDAKVYLARVRAKIGKLAEEFATGRMNRDQFQELFEHYQREQRTIEAWIESAPDSEEWRNARTEGKSIAIRKQYMARVKGYTIYKNDSGMPIATIGEFKLDAALIVPMLSSYRSATREIFGAGMRSTEIEDGQWLSFIPGKVTTFMALFSAEPSPKQLEKLEELHILFERANRHLLTESVIDPSKLALPHQTVIRLRGNSS